MEKLSNARNRLMVASAVAMTILGSAGVASAQEGDPDQLETAITTVQNQIVGYAVPIGAALVAVGLAFVAVKLIPRVIRMVSSRLG